VKPKLLAANGADEILTAMVVILRLASECEENERSNDESIDRMAGYVQITGSWSDC